MSRRRRGSGTIELFRDKSGATRYRARVPREDGTREPLGVYPTREAAELAIDAARNRAADLVHIGGLTVKDYGARFLDQRESDRLRAMRQDRSRWKVLVEESPLADLPMRGVQRADAKQWVRWLTSRRIKMKNPKHPSHGKRMQRSGMQNALNLVRKAFDEAMDELGLASNPFAGVKLPKDAGRTHEPWTYLLPEEQTALLDSLCDRPMRWALVAFSLFTGMRQAEVYSLRWEDVGSTTVVVRYGAQGLPTKGGRVRKIPILDQAQNALEIARRNRKQPKGLVFPNRLGTRRYEGEPSWWKAELERAGLGDPKKRHDGRPVRWHDLRHTAGTSLANGWWGKEWDLRDVQQMLGHASLLTTERYAHHSPKKLLKAAEGTKYTPTFAEQKVKRLGA